MNIWAVRVDERERWRSVQWFQRAKRVADGFVAVTSDDVEVATSEVRAQFRSKPRRVGLKFEEAQRRKRRVVNLEGNTRRTVEDRIRTPQLVLGLATEQIQVQPGSRLLAGDGKR